MKKLILSLLFLFPVITHSATAQVSSPTPYRIEDTYFTEAKFLNFEENQTLFNLDSKNLVPKHYGKKPFLPHSAFATVKKKSDLMLLPVIDTTSKQWAGYAIFTKQDDTTLHLDYLIVGPNHQKKGIGRMVIDYLFQTLKPKIIKLKATSKSAPYYAKTLGFTNGPEYDDFYKENPYLKKQS